MRDVQAKPGFLQIIFRNDNDTPQEFVVDLLHSVFKKSADDTARLLEEIEKYDQAVCGTYPRERANELLAAPDDASGLLDIRSSSRARRLRRTARCPTTIASSVARFPARPGLP